jgi:nucleoid-associated protein YgaU
MGRVAALVGLIGLLMVAGMGGGRAGQPGGDADAVGEKTPVRLPITAIATPSPATTAVVVPGDHLWKISEHHLDSADPALEVAPYWRQVIEVNTPRLRSGDPDLIFPGEVIELPALSERP